MLTTLQAENPEQAILQQQKTLNKVKHKGQKDFLRLIIFN